MADLEWWETCPRGWAEITADQAGVRCALRLWAAVVGAYASRSLYTHANYPSEVEAWASARAGEGNFGAVTRLGISVFLRWHPPDGDTYLEITLIWGEKPEVWVEWWGREQRQRLPLGYFLHEPEVIRSGEGPRPPS